MSDDSSKGGIGFQGTPPDSLHHAEGDGRAYAEAYPLDADLRCMAEKNHGDCRRNPVVKKELLWQKKEENLKTR